MSEPTAGLVLLIGLGLFLLARRYLRWLNSPLPPDRPW